MSPLGGTMNGKTNTYLHCHAHIDAFEHYSVLVDQKKIQDSLYHLLGKQGRVKPEYVDVSGLLRSRRYVSKDQEE